MVYFLYHFEHSVAKTGILISSRFFFPSSRSILINQWNCTSHRWSKERGERSTQQSQIIFFSIPHFVYEINQVCMVAHSRECRPSISISRYWIYMDGQYASLILVLWLVSASVHLVSANPHSPKSMTIITAESNEKQPSPEKKWINKWAIGTGWSKAVWNSSGHDCLLFSP